MFRFQSNMFKNCACKFDVVCASKRTAPGRYCDHGCLPAGLSASRSDLQVLISCCWRAHSPREQYPAPLVWRQLLPRTSESDLQDWPESSRWCV